MNTKDYTYLLNKPYSLNERHTAELESILIEFPYLQSARAIYLKGLYNKDSFRYNSELKKTAAYTTDRSVLFDFIISEEFRSIDKAVHEEKEQAISQISVTDSMVVHPPVDKLEQSIKLSIKEAVAEAEELSVKIPETVIESAPIEEPLTGKPLQFDQAETHSFAEWLQLSKLTPIVRAETQKEPEMPAELAKKISLIDKFIEANPKIAPTKNDTSAQVNLGKSQPESPGLMTETLARVYLEQKKYTKAIQAYEILILKYPEKSVFFADRILEIKNLQQKQ
ncbi:hypothetical protein FMM05_07895 [Flavobacterium zepuense]|uniref:Tetratricopeptide repeat protein n=1 Tax=Flavobacterium zepuense TaxID=2593302 RepID=A0A552V452_9FLAO|nr:tetratricopeptide repeat protein [Flavobacterium zepuense]TRW25219.1 hypothetical protein FMM05_07895 [Flavobacterium zepuense]